MPKLSKTIACNKYSITVIPSAFCIIAVDFIKSLREPTITAVHDS